MGGGSDAPGVLIGIIPGGAPLGRGSAAHEGGGMPRGGTAPCTPAPPVTPLGAGAIAWGAPGGGAILGGMPRGTIVGGPPRGGAMPGGGCVGAILGGAPLGGAIIPRGGAPGGCISCGGGCPACGGAGGRHGRIFACGYVHRSRPKSRARPAR